MIGTLFVGLLGATLLYVAVVQINLTLIRRAASAGSRSSLASSIPEGFPSAAWMLRRFGIEWLVIFALCFLVFDLIQITVWQQLGLCALCAAVWASSSLGEVSRKTVPRPYATNLLTRLAPYWLLRTLDIFAMMAVVCLTIALAWRLA